MPHELKVGARVRVQAEDHVSGYPPGEKGIVLFGPEVYGSERAYYVVRMDHGIPHVPVVFAADEIKPDES
jgi:hypothetical protein